MSQRPARARRSSIAAGRDATGSDGREVRALNTRHVPAIPAVTTQQEREGDLIDYLLEMSDGPGREDRYPVDFTGVSL
jgi:hypothetical protein